MADQLALGPEWVKAPRKRRGGNPDINRILEAIAHEWGQPIMFWAKEAAAVKKMLTEGYTPDQIIACWRTAQNSYRWAGRWIPMAILAQDIGEWARNGKVAGWDWQRREPRPEARMNMDDWRRPWAE